MLQKVEAFIRKKNMIRPGDHVIAGVSGGADSVCLFLMLEKLSKSFPFSLSVVHVHHGIREEAGADADFVSRLCEGYKIPCRIFRENVPAYAHENGLTVEEAGRVLRYRAFQAVAEELTAKDSNVHVKIAVAHHMNDCAETVLFNLFRGTALKGLAGIRPMRDRIIRPLLCLDRSEIEAYLEREHADYCTDATNADETYTRNKLRHRILAYADSEICHHASRHIAETAAYVEEAETFLSKVTQEAFARCTDLKADAVTVRLSDYRKEDPFLQKRILMLAAETIAGTRKDLSAVHLKAAAALAEKEDNGSADLPYGIVVRKVYDDLIFSKGKESGEVNLPEMEVTIPGEAVLPDGTTLSFTIRKALPGQEIPQKKYTKWFDYDKIRKSVTVRGRRSGDFLVISASGHHKSLKEYLIEEKVPRDERSRIPLVADGDHILWIVGYRISEAYKVGETTDTILQIVVTGGPYDE